VSGTAQLLNVNVPDGSAAGLAARLREALGRGDVKWLSPGKAFEIELSGHAAHALAKAKEIAGTAKADINLVPSANRRKKLLIADMDSTIIGCECLDELADMAGLKDKVSAITERAMRGELDFAAALRERVGMLKGLELAALDRVYTDRIRLNPGARTLLATMRANGAHTLLVSGGFGYFTSRVARDAGFHGDQANTLLDDGKALLGTVGDPILGREAKLAALEKAVADLGIGFEQTLAVGDGANDLDMIQRAGLGVAYHAKPVVAAAAGASISYGDLTGLLYLQGYRDEDFVRLD
jgi:phosphoserine phosphatase